mmetsp:Transcript_32654/g.44354  ORF Transcript_32654/g.44354 Transcript_32654/m.44354 type:complete len:98 (+) Transcript_32654:247-540(+)
MDNTVESLHCAAITSSKRSEDLRSRKAVDSSMTRIFGRRTSARATMTSCLCPTDKSDGDSTFASASGLVVVRVICRASRPQRSRAAKISASVCSPLT